MTKKQLIRGIAFILLVCCVLTLLCDLFEREKTSNFAMRATTFRKLEENTLDAVWIGTSGVDRYWIAGKAFEEHGMTVYPYSSDAMPVWLYLTRLKEVYRTQNPQLVILDVRAFTQANTRANIIDTRGRRVLDALPFFSREYFETAFRMMDIAHQVEPEEDYFKISLFLPFVKYHNMWSEKDYSIYNHIGDEEHRYGGFWIESASIRRKVQKYNPYDTEVTRKLDPISEACLYEIIDYAKANNIELLFVDTPQYKTDKQNARSNVIYQILDEQGMNYINYCLIDENGNFALCPNISRETDFYAQGHVNYYGAEKFTTVMAKYLAQHYDFPDHRDDERIKAQWGHWYPNIKTKVATMEAKKKK